MIGKKIRGKDYRRAISVLSRAPRARMVAKKRTRLILGALELLATMALVAMVIAGLTGNLWIK